MLDNPTGCRHRCVESRRSVILRWIARLPLCQGERRGNTELRAIGLAARDIAVAAAASPSNHRTLAIEPIAKGVIDPVAAVVGLCTRQQDNGVVPNLIRHHERTKHFRRISSKATTLLLADVGAAVGQHTAIDLLRCATLFQVPEDEEVVVALKLLRIVVVVNAADSNALVVGHLAVKK